MHAVPYILQLTDTFFLLWIFLTIQSYIGSWKLHVLAMWINNVKFPFSSQSNSVIYTVVFLSQIRTWMCSYLCSVRVKMIGDCLFCWYWWKCLPSLFKGDCSYSWYWWNLWPSCLNFLFKIKNVIWIEWDWHDIISFCQYVP